MPPVWEILYSAGEGGRAVARGVLKRTSGHVGTPLWTDRHTRLKTSPSRNFVGGSKKQFLTHNPRTNIINFVNSQLWILLSGLLQSNSVYLKVSTLIWCCHFFGENVISAYSHNFIEKYIISWKSLTLILFIKERRKLHLWRLAVWKVWMSLECDSI